MLNKLLITLLIVIFLNSYVVVPYKHLVPEIKGNAHVWSRHKEGLSTMVKFPHKTAMGFVRSADTSVLSSADFWSAHSEDFGVASDHMVHSHTHSGASGYDYEHHAQYMYGRKVFGSSVALAVRQEDGDVVRARGHTVSSYLLSGREQAMRAEGTLVDSVAVPRVDSSAASLSLQRHLVLNYGSGENVQKKKSSILMDLSLIIILFVEILSATI